jgi:hypothetical protein
LRGFQVHRTRSRCRPVGAPWPQRPNRVRCRFH